MEEVRQAHSLGARTVFFSDDNFFGNRAYTEQLLTELVGWNSSQARPLTFSTQITVQIADHDHLLKLLADARFSVLFLGVESIREENLKEVHKLQNMQKDIYERIRRISSYGLVPFMGLIVGFDHDDSLVFDELYNFIYDTSSPVAGISLLNAPRKTPLYRRLKEQGRIIDAGGDWQLSTNIVPKHMSYKELLERYWSLFKKVYEPKLFEERLESWLGGITYFTDIYTKKKFDWKVARSGYSMFMYFLFSCDPEVRSLFFRIVKKAWKINPRLMKRVFTTMAQYAHFYEFVKKESMNNVC